MLICVCDTITRNFDKKCDYFQSVLDNAQKNFSRAERDNDLIYHQDVPAASSLPPTGEASLVQSQVSKALIEPKTIVKTDAVIFGELLGWGARRAIGEHDPCFPLVWRH